MNERKLRAEYLIYALSVLLFTVALSAAFLLNRYSSEMRDTVDKLRALSGNSVKVKRATQSAHDAVARIRKEIQPGYFSSPSENVIFQSVDAIREQAGDAEVIVESLLDKGDRMEIPVTLKGPLSDYAQFLKTLHFLESLQFPFFSVTELILTKETDKPSSYELRGLVKTLKPGGTPNMGSARRSS